MWFDGKSALRSSCGMIPGPYYYHLTQSYTDRRLEYGPGGHIRCQLGNFGHWLYSGSSPLPTHYTLSDLTGIQIKCHRFWESRRCEVPLPPNVTMTLAVYFYWSWVVHGRTREWKKFFIVPNTADSVPYVFLDPTKPRYFWPLILHDIAENYGLIKRLLVADDRRNILQTRSLQTKRSSVAHLQWYLLPVLPTLFKSRTYLPTVSYHDNYLWHPTSMFKAFKRGILEECSLSFKYYKSYIDSHKV